MDLPIPTHLKEILSLMGDENNEFEVTGKIRCSCGNEFFEIWESNERLIVKAVCKQCKKEYLIFDNGKTLSVKSESLGARCSTATWHKTGIPVSLETEAASAAPLRISSSVVSPHRCVLLTIPVHCRPVTASMLRRYVMAASVVRTSGRLAFST